MTQSTETILTDPPALPDWLAQEFPFRRRMIQLGRWGMHYVDEGEGPVVLMQHGNPTWSFLWRKVIRLLADKPVRVIAPDLVGLGLSTKPRAVGMHSLRFHALNLGRFVQALDLTDITIVGQDWGGPIVGLMAHYQPERVAGAVFANTGLSAPSKKRPLSAFHLLAHLPLVSGLLFRGFNFPLPILHRVQGNPASIGPFEKRAYRWPLRAFRDRAAPLALARMVATGPHHPSSHYMRKTRAWGGKICRSGASCVGAQRPDPGTCPEKRAGYFPGGAPGRNPGRALPSGRSP